MSAPLGCKTQRETFSEVTAGCTAKFTAPPEPMLLDVTGNNCRFSWCLLPHLTLTPLLINNRPLCKPSKVYMLFNGLIMMQNLLNSFQNRENVLKNSKNFYHSPLKIIKLRGKNFKKYNPGNGEMLRNYTKEKSMKLRIN